MSTPVIFSLSHYAMDADAGARADRANIWSVAKQIGQLHPKSRAICTRERNPEVPTLVAAGRTSVRFEVQP